MPTRDDQSRIQETVEDDGTPLFRGECNKCHYQTTWFKDKRTALSLLSRHRTSRAHKSNTGAKHRFEA